MTKEQRRQALDFGKIRGTGMPVPQGMSTVQSRAHTLNIYYETTGANPFFYNWRNKNIIGGVWKSKTAPASSWTKKATPSSAWTPKQTPQDGSTQII